jgi:hypothetical protein
VKIKQNNRALSGEMWIDGMPLDGQDGQPIIGAGRKLHLVVAVVPVKTEKALLGRTEGQREIKAPPVTVTVTVTVTSHDRPHEAPKEPVKASFQTPICLQQFFIFTTACMQLLTILTVTAPATYVLNFSLCQFPVFL